MTAADLRDLFLATLVKEAGGNRRRWRIVLGEVRVYDRATHAHCNWSVSPSGSYDEIAEVERVADDLRARHPLID
ncbi:MULTISPECIES: hypothetical protein [unclassified Sphingomonas]|uniref:hypothetical protein n=1 Tax=unclassified Sphingomonas TaxID=196159 RepID=UPI00226A2A40|nr:MULTISPECIES: hypothetical protein [unclassified Sphingomonas]